MGNKVFTHLLNMESHKTAVVSSLLALFNGYFDWIKDDIPLVTDVQKYTLGYLLSLPKISPSLFNGKHSPPLLFLIYAKKEC